jgi:phenylpropionate dioxygenase-like ring-hydroxylating dioxygenase large terminal subunit
MAAKVIHAFPKPADTFAEGAKTLPQKYFVSPEVFEEEREKIFARQWVLVGHQSDVEKAGDYFLRDVLPSPEDYGATSAAESVIVVRDKDGEVRAFYNVCRHRGTRLCEESSGHAPAIQCPYHAWTYGLDGRLIGSPHMDEVPGFDRSDYSLHPVKVGVWEGFVFVNLSDTSIPLEEWLAPLSGKFSHWNLARLRSVKRVEYDVKANWKLMFENYAECYHCPGVHPMLSKVSPYDSAENDLAEGPFLGGFMRINKGKSLTMSGEACAMEIEQEHPPSQSSGVAGPPSQSSGVAGPPSQSSGVAGEGKDRVFYYSIFPNMLLSMHPEYVMVHQLWPLAPDRTLIVCGWLFHPEAAKRNDFNPEDAIEFWDVTNKQDWHVCELSQQGIASRAYQPGPYGSRESIPAAWDREYLRRMK